MKALPRFVLAMLLATPVAIPRAAELPPLQNAWYRVEILIFERGVDESAASAPELLLLQTPRAFPRTTLALSNDDGTPEAAYALDATTLAEPAFPSVDATVPISRPRSTAPQTGPNTPTTSAPIVPPEPTPALRAATVLAAFETQLGERSFRLLPPDTFELKQEAGRLQRDGAYRVLLHGAWIQPVPVRDSPLPLLIQTGDRSAAEWQIEGTIDVTLGRYLHVDTRLWYSPAPTEPRLAPLPAQVTGTTSITNDDVASNGYMELHEERRMRSNELHYFDHPRFGMLVRIDPVLLPDALLAELTGILGEPVVLPAGESAAGIGESSPTSGPGRAP